MNNENTLLAIKPAFVPQAQAMLAATERVLEMDEAFLEMDMRVAAERAAAKRASTENLTDVPQDRGSENGYEYLPDIKTAVVAINGVFGHKLSAAQKAYGGVDVVDVIDAIESAAGNEAVERIVLDIDSPGGTVGGIPELAETIEDVQRGGQKQIIAFTDSMMASAAYWAAAGANAIYAAPSAEVGSIGVYMPVVDTSQSLKEQGINVELIKAGKFKGAGFPGVAIDEDVRQFLQAEVSETYDEFASFVTKYRPTLGGDKMQGQTFSGKRAAQIGMADGVKKNLNSLLETF